MKITGAAALLCPLFVLACDTTHQVGVIRDGGGGSDQTGAGGAAPTTPRAPQLARCGSFARDSLTVTALAHSPDGSRLAAGFQDNRVRIYGLPDGKLERTLAVEFGQTQPSDSTYVARLAFSPDGALLAVARDDGASRYSVDIYAVETGALDASLNNTAAVNLAFSGDSTLLLVTLDPARVASNLQQEVVNISAGRVLGTFASSQRAAWADAGQSVVVFDDSGTAGDGVYTVYYAGSGEVTRRGSITGPGLDWRPIDGNNALAIVPGSAGEPTQLGLFTYSPFDNSPSRRVWQSLGSVMAGQRVDALPAKGGVAVFAGQTISVLSMDTGALVRSLSSPFPQGASLSPDGQSVVGFDGDRLIQIGSDGTAFGGPFDTRGAHFGRPMVLAISSDAQMLASEAGDLNAIWLWNVADRSFRRDLRGAPMSLSSAFSPGNGMFLAAGHGAMVWNVSDGTKIDPLVIYDPSTQWPTSGAFSPDGTLIAYGQPSAIEIRRVTDGTTMRSLEVAAPSRALAFSPDSALLATSAPELFRVSDGALVWSMAASSHQPPDAAGPTAPPYDSVSFTPDGNALLVSQCLYDRLGPIVSAPLGQSLTGSRCSPPKLVRLSDGATLREYPAARGARPHLSPDGTWMVAGADLVDMTTGASLPLGVDAQFSVFLDATTIAAETAAGDIDVICLSSSQ